MSLRTRNIAIALAIGCLTTLIIYCMQDFLGLIVGAVIMIFIGGAAATLLTKSDRLPQAEKFDASMVAVVIPIITICAILLMGWYNIIQSGHNIDQYGRPVDPFPPIMVVFMLALYSAVFFMISAAGCWTVLKLKNRRHSVDDEPL